MDMHVWSWREVQFDNAWDAIITRWIALAAGAGC